MQGVFSGDVGACSEAYGGVTALQGCVVKVYRGVEGVSWCVLGNMGTRSSREV